MRLSMERYIRWRQCRSVRNYDSSREGPEVSLIESDLLRGLARGLRTRWSISPKWSLDARWKNGVLDNTEFTIAKLGVGTSHGPMNRGLTLTQIGFK